MRNIKFFPTLREYKQFISNEIVTNKEFYESPFYSGLINFIAEQRTPIFFDMSQEYEKAHFTQYFNYVLTRKYPNRYIEDLYYLHDFVHMTFNYPIQPRNKDISKFYKELKRLEFFASQETETLIYYKIPGLREKTLKKTILFDLLNEKESNKPDIYALYDLIQKFAYNHGSTINEYFDLNKTDHKEALSYYQLFAVDNEIWKNSWYYGFPQININVDPGITLLPENYEQYLTNYKPLNDEALYQKNVLKNIRLGLHMLGETNLPETFEDCEEALKRLEGKVIMEQAAIDFHEVYKKRSEVNRVY